MLELDQIDRDKLDDLVERYQKLIPGLKSTKAMVVRQLIRHMFGQKQLPPLL